MKKAATADGVPKRTPKLGAQWFREVARCNALV